MSEEIADDLPTGTININFVLLQDAVKYEFFVEHEVKRLFRKNTTSATPLFSVDAVTGQIMDFDNIKNTIHYYKSSEPD